MMKNIYLKLANSTQRFYKTLILGLNQINLRRLKLFLNPTQLLKVNALNSLLFVSFTFLILMTPFSVKSQDFKETIDANDQDQALIALKIGERVPKEFWNKEHLFFAKGDTLRKSLSEYQGKMVVFSFWSSGCGKCFYNQEAIQEYIEKYGDKLKVIMVNSRNTRDDYGKIKTLYKDEFFKNNGIERFESIIDDDYLMTLFASVSFPHYVWINGIDRLEIKTYRNLLDKNNLPPFID